MVLLYLEMVPNSLAPHGYDRNLNADRVSASIVSFIKNY